MDRYLRYGLPLLATSIIVTKLVSLVFLLYNNYPDFMARVGYEEAIISILSKLAGLVAGAAGIVIIIESARTAWDIRRIAMTFLGFALAVVCVYALLFYPVFRLLAGAPGVPDDYTLAIWVRNVFGALTVISAVLILVSLQEEGAVARMGFFLYSIVGIAGVAFRFFGMEWSMGIGIVLALLGFAAAVLLIKRM